MICLATKTGQVMKLLEAMELKPSRAVMDRALDEMDWGSIGAENDVFFALFRAAFRSGTTPRPATVP